MSSNPKPSAASIQRAMDALDAYWQTHLAPPTLRELTAQMGLRAWSNVSVALHAAAAQGLVATWRTDAHTVFVPRWVTETLTAASPAVGRDAAALGEAVSNNDLTCERQWRDLCSALDLDPATATFSEVAADVFLRRYENVRLRAALQVYANETHWNFNRNSAGGFVPVWEGDCPNRPWDTARVALIRVGYIVPRGHRDDQKAQP